MSNSGPLGPLVNECVLQLLQQKVKGYTCTFRGKTVPLLACFVKKIDATLKCLNIGTPKTINFPFVSNGKLMIFGVPIFEHIIIRL